LKVTYKIILSATLFLKISISL